MKENKKFIESLARVIESKKVDLGVDSSIAEIKGLAKYMNFESVELPKKYNPNKVANIFATNKADGFQQSCYTSYHALSKDVYIFEKITSEVAKKVSADMLDMLDGDNAVENINNYILEKTDFKNIKISLVDDSSDDEDVKLAKEVFDKLKKANIQMILVENTSEKAKMKSYYSVLNSKLKTTMIGEWTRRYSGAKAEIRDFILLIAIGRIIKDCCTYFRKDINRAKLLLSRKLYPNRIFEDELSLEDIIERIDSVYISELMEETTDIKFPVSLISLWNHCMADIVKETGIIAEYKKTIKDVSTEYAKPYMTKKHITKKIEGFMKDNTFLNMFGYVEADNSCDMEKLDELQKEFIEFSSLLPLPVAKDQSLRFRRLGNIKADGVYYAMFKSLCIDLDGVYSFTHEMFHMIDYMEGLLSLDVNFRELMNKYEEIVTNKIDSLDKSSEIYLAWNSRNKHNKDYYLKGTEIFARLGEIYVSEILGIESSFVNRNLYRGMGEYVYPKDKELASLIKEYFDKLFENIKAKYEIVSFDKGVNNSSKEAENLDTESFLILEGLTGPAEQISFF